MPEANRFSAPSKDFGNASPALSAERDGQVAPHTIVKQLYGTSPIEILRISVGTNLLASAMLLIESMRLWLGGRSFACCSKALLLCHCEGAIAPEAISSLKIASLPSAPRNDKYDSIMSRTPPSQSLLQE